MTRRARPLGAVAEGQPDLGIGLQRCQPGRFLIRLWRATQQDQPGPVGSGKPKGDLGRDTPRASANDNHLACAKHKTVLPIRRSGGNSHKLHLIRGAICQTHLGRAAAQQLFHDPISRGFMRLVRGVEINCFAVNVGPFEPRGLE